MPRLNSSPPCSRLRNGLRRNLGVCRLRRRRSRSRCSRCCLALRQWAQPLEPALWRLLVPGEVTDGFDLARRKGTGIGFAQHLLDALDISFKTDDCDRKRIPVSGSAVIVANHPYGIVEGLILAALLDRVRPDWKIMVNSILASIAELRAHMILVNPFAAPEANSQNRAPLARVDAPALRRRRLGHVSSG
jgi:hypothetical protein